MSLKMRIWMLPAIAAVIFLISGSIIAAMSASASNAIGAVSATDYPFLDRSEHFAAKLDALEGLIAGAVAQQESQRLTEAEAAATAMRKTLEHMQASEAFKDQGNALAGQFETYYGAAGTSARIFLGTEKGDGAAAVAQMQAALKKLHATVDDTRARAKEAFDQSLAGARTGVRNAVLAMVAAASFIIIGMGAGSYLLVATIWRQIGGEPAYARSVLRAMAQGDLAQRIEVSPNADASVLAAVRDMAQGL